MFNSMGQNQTYDTKFFSIRKDYYYQAKLYVFEYFSFENKTALVQCPLNDFSFFVFHKFKMIWPPLWLNSCINPDILSEKLMLTFQL